jgi:hypothetical protein
MIELEKEEFYVLPVKAYGRGPCISSIATEVYGRSYNGIGSGTESNDTFQTYDFRTEDMCKEFRWDHDEDATPLDDWLALKVGDEVTDDWGSKRVIRYESDLERHGPAPSWVLADLILKGYLPYGQYLVETSW